MHLSIVLVAPARAENIGAAARAMKTMGFTDLRIVDSTAHLEPAARWVAHGSGDILDNITTYATLADALHDISFTVATTARSRAKFHYYATPADLGQAVMVYCYQLASLMQISQPPVTVSDENQLAALRVRADKLLAQLGVADDQKMVDWLQQRLGRLEQRDTAMLHRLLHDIEKKLAE